MGDINNQFSSTPDGAEDMPLAALAETLEPTNTGQPSLAFSETIGRWISSILPSKCNLNTLRDYLKQNWGLGPSRQTSVILFALTQTIADGAGRLPSSNAAKSLFDAAASKYAEFCGLTLQKASAASAQAAAGPVVDKETLDKITRDQRMLAAMQYQALSRYLGLEGGDEAKLAELEVLHETQLDRLGLWTSECGADFEAGIKPRFNAKHLRHYNFAWSQARIDICTLYHDIVMQKVLMESGSLDTLRSDHLWQIANRSGPRTLDLVNKLAASAAGRATSPGFAAVGNTLAGLIRNSLVQLGPKARFAFQCSSPKTTVRPDGSMVYEEVPRLLGGSTVSYADALRQIGHAALKTQVDGQWSTNDGLTRKMFDIMSQAQSSGLTFSGKTVLVLGAGAGSIGAELVKNLLAGGATVIATTSRHISAAQDLYRQMYRDFGARGSEMFVLPFNQASIKDCQDLIAHIYSDSGLGRQIDVVIPFAAMPEGGAEIDQLGSKSELAHRLMLTNVLRLIGNVIQEKTKRNIHFRPTQVLLPLSPNHGSFGGDGLYSESKLGLESLLNRFHSESWKDMVSICGVSIGWTRGTGLMESNDQLAEAVESHGVLTFTQQEMALNILSLVRPEIAHFCEDEALLADFGGGLGRLQNLKAVINEARSNIREKQQCNTAIAEEDARERAMTSASAKAPPSVSAISTKRRCTKLDLDFPTLPDFENDLKHLHQDLNGMVDLSSTVVIVGFSELGPWGNARTRWQMESQRKLAQSGYIEMAWMMGLIKHFDGEHKSGGHYVGWVDAQSSEAVADDEVAGKYSTHIIEHSGIRLIQPEAAGGYDPQKREFLQEIAVEDDLPEFDATPATAEALKKKHGESIVVRRSADSETVRVQVKAGARIMMPKLVPLAASTVAGLLPTGWSSARYGIPDDIIQQVDSVTLYTLCCVAEAFLSAGIDQPQEIFKYLHLSEMGNFIGSALGPTNKSKEMFHDIRMNKQVQGDIYAEMNTNVPNAWVNMLLLGANGPIKTPVGACASGLESLDIGVESILSGKTSMCLVGAVDNFQEDESHAFSTVKATVDAAKQFAEGRQPSEFSRPTAETRAGFLESAGCGIQLVCNAELALRMGLPIYAVVAGSTMAADKISRSVPAPGQGLLTFARESHGAAESPLLDIKFRKEKMQKAISRAVHPDGSDSDDDVSRSDSLASSPPSSVSDGTWARSSSAGSYAVISKDGMRYRESTDSGMPSPTTSSALGTEVQNIRRQWGNDFRKQDLGISPMRASLAVFGLTVDDIGAVSLHGTSTKANDTNEPDTVNQQMIHLGRTGAPLLAICQKNVTGHPKGPAASWMLNGCIQAMHSRLVPGNPNCDNIDVALERFEHLVFPTESIHVQDIKAFLLNSFGFGQKGAQMIGVNPRYLFATLDVDAFTEYERRCTKRTRIANRAFAKAMTSNTVVKVQSNPPYEKEEMSRVLLDPFSRLSADTDMQRMRYNPACGHGDMALQAPMPLVSRDSVHENRLDPAPAFQRDDLTNTTSETHRAMATLIKSMPEGSSIGSIGVDIESLSKFDSDKNPLFLERNFTQAELDAARRSSDAHGTYVSRWCAKEAVFKSLAAKSKGAGAPLKDIEIWNDEKNAPKVKVGLARTICELLL